ncbi:TPA: GTP pyrophosphokinase [Vibrio diabolicus]
MNEQEFFQKWQEQEPMYSAWGELVVSTICEKLNQAGEDLSSFLKQPCNHRVKSAESLVDKAFYRPGKNYQDPFNDIEDKVGCRFVVLLVEHINKITEIIENEDLWDAVECRHFTQERNEAPLLFTYQSVHYVVRLKSDFEYGGVVIEANTPCEIQIRTLLQHAYAELTHDAVYKAKTMVEPEVHRTVARSMALIETTDDFFSTVNNKLACDVTEKYGIQGELDKTYFSFTGLKSIKAQKSSIVILDQYKHLLSEDFADKIKSFLDANQYISELIIKGRECNPLYTQSIILFIYWMIKKRKNILLAHWPLERKIIEKLASELGVSLDQT